MHVTRHSTRDISTMIAVAKAFYFEGRSKVKIAADMGLSRFKVAQLLSDARDLGIIKFVITDPFDVQSSLKKFLENELAIESVVLVADSGQIQEDRDALAAKTAELLVRDVTEGSVIGLSWGRTLAGLGSAIEYLPEVDVVQLTGLVGTDPTHSPLRLMTTLNPGFQVRSHALLSPLFVSSAATAEGMRHEPDVDGVFSWYDKLDIAILSIGSWANGITQLGQYFSDTEKRRIDEAGAIADFAGIFIDSRGNEVAEEFAARRISVSLDQLRQTRHVIAAAAGEGKATAIVATARAGVLDTLVTTVTTAMRLEELLRAERDDLQPKSALASGS